MLKKLRGKFVLINMVIVTLVLIVVFTTVVVINRNQRVDEVYDALDGAITNSGMVSMGKRPSNFDADGQSTMTSAAGAAQASGASSASPSGGMGSAPASFAQSSTSGSTTGSTPGSTLGSTPGSASGSTLGSASGSTSGSFPFSDPGFPHDGRDGASQYVNVASYIVDSSGTIEQTINENISIDSDVLSDAISRAISSQDEMGRFSDLGLYYRYRETPDGIKVAFASTSYVDSSTDSLALTLVSVGLATLAVFLVISFFLSKWATKPVERAWNQQRQFVGDASHELKTPLTVIMANNSILMAHPDQTVASQMQWVESTESESHLMQGLINDLLFLAKPDNEQLRLEFSDVNLSDLVESNLLQFESVAFEDGVTLNSNIESGIVIPGNESRLQRLIGTLLDNACKYCNRGGTVDVTLKRSTSTGGSQRARGPVAVYQVHNTGEVISEQDQEHIFDRFYRVDKARGAGGYGLGLAIAKEVAEEHHGTITVTSTAAAGTTFSATIGGSKPER